MRKALGFVCSSASPRGCWTTGSGFLNLRGIFPYLQRAEAAAARCDLNEDQRETLTTFVFVAEALKRERERERERDFGAEFTEPALKIEIHRVAAKSGLIASLTRHKIN